MSGEGKILAGVVVTYISDHGAEQGLVIGQFAALDFAADEVAEDAAKVLVARIGHEGTGVRDHADEAGEQTDV